MTKVGALPVLSAAYMKANPAWLIDPASVRPSINRGPSGPVRNTLFRGKLVNQLTRNHSLLAPLRFASANYLTPPKMRHAANMNFIIKHQEGKGHFVFISFIQ